jgi:flavin-dependent dehydrogenase
MKRALDRASDHASNAASSHALHPALNYDLNYDLNPISPPTQPRVLIAGGGLAGAAAACWLAQSGKSVLLLERESETGDKICGEFLSAEAQHYLGRLGLDPLALGAHPITHLRLVRAGRSVAVALPFKGLGLSRRVLDAALLRRAEQCGAEVRRGQQIISATRVGTDELESQDVPGTTPSARTEAASWRVELAGHPTEYAPTLFLATGKHDVRTLKRELRSPPEDLVGFKTYFALSSEQTRALQHHVEVVMFEQGYAGLQLVENGRANLCLLAERNWLQAHGAQWDGLLAALLAVSPHLRARLSGARALLDKALSIYRVPYGYVHQPCAEAPAELYRLGDQAGVIHSFSGDGMSIALHSAALATQAYLERAGPLAYHQRIERDLGGQIGRAMALYRLARRPAGQRLLMYLAQYWPASLQLAALLTRVSPRALLHGAALQSGTP